MKKYKTYILVTILISSALSLYAQEHGRVSLDKDRHDYLGTSRYRQSIDWLPNSDMPQRYAISLHLLQFLNYGMRIDFEFELDTPGRWLQFGLIGHYLPQYDYSKPASNSYDKSEPGWRHPMDDTNVFEKLSGCGLAVTYKRFFSEKNELGVYWSAGVHFNYLNVIHRADGYYTYYEDGMQLWEKGKHAVSSRYYKPGINFNLGISELDFSPNLLFDAYIGVGFDISIRGGHKTYLFETNMFSFGYYGGYITCGLRIGWVWPNKK